MWSARTLSLAAPSSRRPAGYLNATAVRRLLATGRGVNAGLPTPPPAIISDSDSPQTDAVRSWLSNFKSVSIPRDAVELKFSRSSGPGGQARGISLPVDMVTKKPSVIEREQGQHQSDRALFSRFALDTTLGSTSFEAICKWSVIVPPSAEFLFFQPSYVASTNSLLISSTVHRSQSQNVDDCLSKVRHSA